MFLLEDALIKDSDYLLELFFGHKKTAHDKAPHNLQQEKWLANINLMHTYSCLDTYMAYGLMDVYILG